MRNTTIITIPDGSDAGKRFRLTEFPPIMAEEFALRCFSTFRAAGVDLPTDPEIGLAGVAHAALAAFAMAPADMCIPLFTAMLECVEIIDPIARPLKIATDITDLATLLMLRQEAMKIHIGALVKATRLVLQRAPNAAHHAHLN
jgi:hypothetical protein